MSELDKILDCDRKNEAITLKYLSECDHRIPQLLEDIANLYITMNHDYGNGASDDDDINAMEASFEKMNITDYDERYKLLSYDIEPSGGMKPIAEAAREAYARYLARRVRGMLLSLVHRNYMRGITDGLRLRTVDMIGQSRVQMEAAALLCLIQQSPTIASEWTSISSDAQGRQFNQKFKGDILTVVESFDLMKEWNLSSGSAHHARYASVFRGLKMSQIPDRSRETTRIELCFQDINADQPWTVLLEVVKFLCIQLVLIDKMCASMPEITDQILIDVRIPRIRGQLADIEGRVRRELPHIS